MIQKLILAIVGCCALAAGIWLAQKPAVVLEARVFEPVRVIKPFTLTNQHDQDLSNAYFDQQWTLIFLGFTHCPDVCPTTLARLASSYKKLKAAGLDNVQVLFVSVDPQRDDPARLKEYTEYFSKEFTAATGGHADLFPFVRDLGLMYSMSEDTSLPEYNVDHSGAISLINPNGQLHAMFKAKVELGGIPGVDMALLESELLVLADRF
ncbi:MAG: protein SCO1/2 [Phenylobacterium sp.]|jgi:protein SCO1/2